MLLVTGITGHTGRYFIQELINNGYKEKIRCILTKKDNEKYLKNTGLNYEIAVGDLNDTTFLDKCCKNVDTILEIFGIRYSINVLNAAIKNNVRRIIFVHTTGIYSKYKMASDEYKTIEKQVLAVSKKNNVKITILRPTMIFGDMCDHNVSKFIKMVDRLRVFPLITNGRALVQPVNARDLGKAYYQVLTNNSTINKNYNLSGEEAISIKNMLNEISKYLGKKTIFIPIPLWLALICAYLLKIITFGRKNIIEKVLRMDETRSFDHCNATKDFNYKPMNFRRGLKNEVQEFIESR